MPGHCIIIGGGFAGLSAAAHLSTLGYKITLLEASPKLGGRAYSFYDEETKTVIDNGQHILMGCYNYTLDFLRLISALENFYTQKKLEVNYLKPDFQLFKLKAGILPYPFNLVEGLLKFNAISLKSRIGILKTLLKLLFVTNQRVENLTVEQWLKSENQDEESLKSFWEIISAGALNTSIEKASAKVFTDVLKEIFLTGKRSAKIILPKKGLTESYVDYAQKYILTKNGEINCSEEVKEILIENDRAQKIITNKDNYADFDFIISAVPYFAFTKFIDKNILSGIPEFEDSTIVNIHIWLKENNLKEKFYGLIDSPVHWIFNKGNHLNLVISDANYLKEKSAEEIFAMTKTELNRFAKIDPENILTYKVIKEKRATFIPTIDIFNKRPSIKTSIKNLFVAGDWVDTGLPSTIESAVKSGKMVSEILAVVSN